MVPPAVILTLLPLKFKVGITSPVLLSTNDKLSAPLAFDIVPPKLSPPAPPVNVIVLPADNPKLTLFE